MAFDVILIADAGLVLWRMRASAPATSGEFARLPNPVKAGLGLLAVLLPLLAASLAVIFIVDRLILRRSPWFRRRSGSPASA
jgi:uncharacterized iron-regulated membrane protein